MKLTTIDYIARDMPDGAIRVLLGSTRDGFAGARVTVCEACQHCHGLVANLGARIGDQNIDEIRHDVSDA